MLNVVFSHCSGLFQNEETGVCDVCDGECVGGCEGGTVSTKAV